MSKNDRKRLNPAALAMKQASIERTLDLAKTAHKAGTLRRITFENSPIERAQPSPVYSEDAVRALATASGARFPELRETDL
jgi:hypothetical protein